MALEGLGKENDVKVRFNIREGVYKQMPISEHFYSRRVPYVAQGPASTSTTVKTSISKINGAEDGEDRVCFTVGRDLFYFAHKSLMQPNQHLDVLDKRLYKGVAPTCHDINCFSATGESVKVAVGFTAGQVQIIDVKAKLSLQIMNEDRSVEKALVTCVKWYPNSENVLLSSHSSGCMYTYDVSQPSTNAAPTYHSQPHWSGEGYSILSLKLKATATTSTNGNSANVISKNPLYKWIMSSDGSGVRCFEFSPCGLFIAIALQNGYLRILNMSTFKMHGYTKSYFGGLLSCAWSPDGRYIAIGGEDDLVSVYSFCEKCVIARGYGHKSWVSDVAFDPYCCFIPSDNELKTFYNMASVAEMYPKGNLTCLSQDSSNNIPCSYNTSCDMASQGTDHVDNLGAVQSNDETRTNCNGEAGLLPHSTMRRLRTYSNVSKFSRLSIGLDPCAPPICYRFGSVGQDTHMCLWELDENILFCSRNPPPINPKVGMQKKRQSSSSGVDCTPAYNSSATTDSEMMVNGASTYSDYSSNGSSSQYHYNNSTSGGIIDPMQLVTTGHSSNTSSSANSTISTTKERKSVSTKHQPVINGVTEKFATLGAHERKRKQAKEHKRNTSLPFSFRATTSNSSSKYALSNKKCQPITPVDNFGTHLCPKIKETPLLEPLVCKKISQSRMTGIKFLQDCIITTCQDGYLQVWKRPAQNKSPTPADISTKKLAGTVV